MVDTNWHIWPHGDTSSHTLSSGIMHLPSEQINLRHSITTLQEQGSASEHLNPAKAFYALKVHDVSQTYLINRTDDREKLAMHLGLHSIVQRRPHILGKKLLV